MGHGLKSHPGEGLLGGKAELVVHVSPAVTSCHITYERIGTNSHVHLDSQEPAFD